MKITPFKNRMYAVACAALLTFTVGCEKEVPQQAKYPEMVLPEAQFHKELHIKASNYGNATFVVEVGASERALLDSIDVDAMTIAFNSHTQQLDQHQESESHQSSSGDRPREIDLQRKFVSIHVLGAFADQPLETYEITFADKFRSLLRKEDVAMRISFTPAEVPPSTPLGKTMSLGWRRTAPATRLYLVGDQGQYSTGVHIFGNFLNGYPPRVVHGLVHPNVIFLNNASCQRCFHGVLNLDDVYVFQDVLRNIFLASHC